MQVLQLLFKCKKYRNNWKELKNIAIITCENKIYKSNIVTVYNKKCKKCCKTKLVYYCNNDEKIGRIKVVKYVRCEQVNYKICMWFYCKADKKICRKKFYI